MADGAQIANAARNTNSNAGAFGDCQRCDKRGFPILPLRFSYVYWDGRSDYGTRADLSKTSFDKMAGELLLRPLSGGYLHVLDERDGGTWRVFFVGRDGSLWEFPAKTSPRIEEYQCGRGDHLTRSSMFSVDRPENAKKIWLSYASTLYTPNKLDEFRSLILKGQAPRDECERTVALMGVRFQMHDVPALLAMAKDESATDKALGIKLDGSNLKSKVPEFSGKIEPFEYSVTPPVNLKDSPVAIGKRVKGACSGGLGGVAVYLDDPIGIAQEIRHLEKITKLKIDAIDAKYARERKVKALVDELGKSWVKSKDARGKLEESGDWELNYKDKLDASRIADFERNYKSEMGTLRGKHLILVDDVQRWCKSTNFETATECDFDSKDVRSTVDMVSQLSTILCGLDATEQGANLAQELMAKDVSRNLWYRALLAGQKDLLSFLSENQGSDVLGSFKSAYGVVDEWINAHEKMAAALNLSNRGSLAFAPGAAGYLKGVDPLFRATLPLSEAIMQLTLSLQALVGKAAGKAFGELRVFVLLGAVWHRTTALPFYEEKTLASLVRENNEVAWGTSIENRNQIFIDTEGRRVAKVKLGDYASELGEAGRKKIPLLRIRFGNPPDVAMMSAEGAREASRQQRRQEARRDRKAEAKRLKNGPGPQRSTLAVAMEQGLEEMSAEFEAFRQAEAENARIAAASARNRARLGSLGAADAVVVPAALRSLQRAPSGNWLSGAMKVARNGGANGAFSAWIGAIQMTALVASYKDLEKKPDAETWAKVMSSTLGVAGAFIEVIAAGYLLSGASADKRLILALTPARIAGIGGLVGGVSGVVGGIVTMVEGYNRSEAGDVDSGRATFIGGAFLTVSGVAAVGGGAAALSSAGLVLGLGPFAWGALALGLAVLGVASIFIGESWRDNPLQTWLRSSCLGTNPAFGSSSDELLAFERLFEIPMELRMQWRKGKFGFGTIVVEVDIPDLSDGLGGLVYGLSFRMKDGAVYTVSENRKISDRSGAGMNDPSQMSAGKFVNATGLSAPTTSPTYTITQKGGVRWMVGYSRDMLSVVAINIKYMPEIDDRPDFIVPAPDGLRKMITAADSV